MKIAIVGTATSEKYAPYNDPSWQIWTLGNNYTRVPRYDRWFEVHTQKWLAKHNIEARHYESLKDCGEKLYLMEPFPQFPDATLYPREQITSKYGTYLTSSIAWMLALAMEEKPTEIGLWGVHMQGENEYAHQRPCCEYLIGRAIERGINIKIHPDSSLLKGEPYCEGLYYDIIDQLLIVKDRVEKARDQANYEVGYYDALNSLKRTFG